MSGSNFFAFKQVELISSYSVHWSIKMTFRVIDTYAFVTTLMTLWRDWCTLVHARHWNRFSQKMKLFKGAFGRSETLETLRHFHLRCLGGRGFPTKSFPWASSRVFSSPELVFHARWLTKRLESHGNISHISLSCASVQASTTTDTVQVRDFSLISSASEFLQITRIWPLRREWH